MKGEPVLSTQPESTSKTRGTNRRCPREDPEVAGARLFFYLSRSSSISENVVFQFQANVGPQHKEKEETDS
jgi:hypothetical protein